MAFCTSANRKGKELKGGGEFGQAKGTAKGEGN